MIRARLWFRCAAMHDPVTPFIVRPAVIGWEAKKRDVGLTIERAFKGDELVLRMKGWVTADVRKVIEVVNRYGYLKVLDERDLVVEVEEEKGYEELERELTRAYRQIYLHSGFKNFLRRIFRFNRAIANSRSFFRFLDIIFRVGILRQDIRNALK